jgi:hypothetical protein
LMQMGRTRTRTGTGGGGRGTREIRERTRMRSRGFGKTPTGMRRVTSRKNQRIRHSSVWLDRIRYGVVL